MGNNAVVLYAYDEGSNDTSILDFKGFGSKIPDLGCFCHRSSWTLFLQLEGATHSNVYI